ncbi:MAG: hypothetical protein WDO19_01635 [Bacteroidota bacterium]
MNQLLTKYWERHIIRQAENRSLENYNRKNNRVIYQLNDDDGKGFIYLLKPGEQILLFTDEGGKLLVGNEDFSYTLNRTF